MIVAFYRGFFFTNFDLVYFRFDLTLFTFRLLNFVINIPSYPLLLFLNHMSVAIGRRLNVGNVRGIIEVGF